MNKLTEEYEFPKIASKQNAYKCPHCDKDVIFKKGKINQPHFAHRKSESPCHYYDRPGESQIHKDAKMLMKSLLDRKTHLCIDRQCECGIHHPVLSILPSDYTAIMEAAIEYRFHHNASNRSADVALIENVVVSEDETTIVVEQGIKYIFEIWCKNKTKDTNRGTNSTRAV